MGAPHALLAGDQEGWTSCVHVDLEVAVPFAGEGHRRRLTSRKASITCKCESSVAEMKTEKQPCATPSDAEYRFRDRAALAIAERNRERSRRTT